MITKIHHVALKCSGIESFRKTVSFYTDVIGMQVKRSWGEGADAGAMLTLDGEDILEIFAEGQEQAGSGSIHHFAFYTDDPDACMAKIREAGYEVTAEPENIDMVLKQPENGERYPLRVAFCKGPLGECIEFFSERQ
jgi:catechol 2,3-dioxygenase-like lactoylglutathione lyase family enzyme